MYAYLVKLSSVSYYMVDIYDLLVSFGPVQKVWTYDDNNGQDYE